MNTSFVLRLGDAVRRQWLMVLCIISAGIIAAAMALVSTHPKFTATTTVLMVAETSESTSGQESTSSQPLLSADLPSLATDPTVLGRFRDDLGESSSLETLRSGITAKVNPSSSIMLVQYSAKTPDVAIRGVNLLSDEIVRFYRQIATSRFDSLIADFNGQLARRRTELARLDGQLAAAAKAYPYIDVSEPGSLASASDSVYGRLIAIRTERDALRATMDADSAALKGTSRLISDAAPIAVRDVVDSDSAYVNVREQYAKDFAALQKLDAFSRPNYPGLIELRALVDREAMTMDNARRRAQRVGPTSNPIYVSALDAKARAQIVASSDAAKLRTLDNEISQLYAQMGQGSVANDVARLRRDHGSAEAAYATIAGRLAKTIADRSEAASTGSVAILDHARSAPEASSLGGKAVAIGILFLSIWLAFTLAVMINGSQQWFRDPQSVEAVYGAKPIGSIA